MPARRRSSQPTPIGTTLARVAEDLDLPPAPEQGQLQLPELVQDALHIDGSGAKKAGALGYTARVLVQATMPHSDPGDVPGWGRANGRLSLVMRPGQYMENGAPKSIGLPYGTYPRLLLAWMTTEAVRTKDRVLHLGPTLSGFMGELGIGAATGGRWGTIPRLRDQMRRLFNSSITVHYGDDQVDAGAQLAVARSYKLWWSPRDPEQAGLWDSTVELTADFYDEITQRPVPIDMRALRALKRSPLRLDIYTWLTYRMYALDRQTTIPWGLLELQFGAEYGRVLDFKKAFIGHLKEVIKVYPAGVAQTDRGLVLRPTAPHIPRRV